MLWLAILVACAGKSTPAPPLTVVEGGRLGPAGPMVEVPSEQPSRFGPVHAITGDEYALAGQPRVMAGHLQVPVRGGADCPSRRFSLERNHADTVEPGIVAATLVLDSGGMVCTSSDTALIDFDLLESLGQGCYDTLLLRVPGEQTVTLPLEGLGCDAEKLAAKAPKIGMRWGQPYRVVGTPVLVDGHIKMTTRYNGGCAKHDWDISVREWRNKPDRTVVVDVIHDADGETCKADLHEDVDIDFSPWLRNAEKCPQMIALHVPDVLPTGELFDREVILSVDRRSCGGKSAKSAQAAKAETTEP